MKIIFTTKGLCIIRIIASIILIGCIVAICIGFFMMLGSAGNFDFAAEQHRPITADELNASITGAIGGIITLVIGAILGATCDNINKTIDSELERRRKIAIEKRKARARQQMEINEELNRDYAAFLESYKTVS